MSTTLRVVLVLLAFCLFAVAISGQAVYTRLAYFFILLIGVNFTWSRLALNNLNFERYPYLRRGEIGQIFEERFELENVGRLPRFFIEVQDHSDLPGSRGSRVHTVIGRKQHRSYLERTRLVQRGVFSLGPSDLVSGDPFGMFSRKKRFTGGGTLMVYPLTVEIQTFPNPPGLLPGGEALRRRTQQITPNVATIRDYVPGDTFNRMSWKHTARRDKFMVKEFELDPLAEVWIFLDAEQSVHSAKPYTPMTDVSDAIFRMNKPQEIFIPPASIEYGTSAAASIGRYYLRRGRAVGLVTSTQNEQILPPDRGSRQRDKIMEALATLKPDGILPFAALLAAQARYLPRGSTVALITPDVKNEIMLSVDQLFRLGLRPVVVLLDAGSFNGAPGTDELAMRIAALGVPMTVMREGEDMATALSLTGSWARDLALIPQRMDSII
jgi:uncharacterized protein (DUF58 family)